MKEERLPWPMLGVLVIAAVLSFIDRQLISLLVDPIRQAVGATDFQIGLLGGPAFAIFFALAGLPLGWLADRVDRGRLIAGGVALWSLATALSGFATSFAHLFLARMGVGVGEATLGPSAHSLIGERFNGPRLPLAMSVYSTGVSLGAGLAFAVGGQIVALAGSPALQLGPLRGLADWQRAFIIVGLPGLLVALLVLLTVRDRRRAVPHPVAGAGLGAFYRARRRLVWLHLVGIGLLSAAGFANLLWLPSVFIRAHGWRPTEIGFVVGVLLMTVGVAGVIAAGAVATRLSRSGRREAPVLTMAVAAFVAAPLGLAPALPDATAALIGFALSLLVSSAFIGLAPAAVQAVTPPPLRGRVAAISLMVTSLIGMVAGPVGVGAVSTYLLGSGTRVGEALALVTLGATLGGALCLWWMRRPFRDALHASDLVGG